MNPEETFSFTSYLEESNNRLWGQHFIVPAPVVGALSEGSEDKRVVCNINGAGRIPMRACCLAGKAFM